MIPALDPYVLEQASWRARLLIHTAGFSADYWEDLRQELVLDCLRRSSKFDPTRGDWPGFVRGVMRNHSTVLFTRMKGRNRWEILAADLPRPVEFQRDSCAEFPERLQPYDGAHALQLSIDVQRILRKLPAQLQIVAQLMGTIPVGEIPRRLAKSRSRFYQLRRELQCAFRRAGYGPAHQGETA